MMPLESEKPERLVVTVVNLSGYRLDRPSSLTARDIVNGLLFASNTKSVQ